LITLIGGVVAWPVVARGQQPIVPVLGYLNASTPSQSNSEFLAALRKGLKESGYTEGENVAIDYRWGENEPDRLPVLAADLVRRRVNVIAATSAPASLAAVKATATIPIVFLVPEDPVRLGLVTSLSRPGGNATGINFFSAELAAKRLELLRTLVPTARRVAALLNPSEPTIAASNRRDAEAAAGPMGLQISFLQASTAAEIDSAFESFARERPDALFISSGPFFTNRRVQLAHLATRHAIPVIHGSRAYPEVGGLMSYGADVVDAHRQAGFYVGRILKGAKLAELPVVQSTKFELVINTSAARLLGLTVPDNLLAIADEVIE
jgi:putative ABC transport system substrate-binding protein